MSAQIRTASYTAKQAKCIDELSIVLGGISKACQYIVDFYMQHNNGDLRGNGEECAPELIIAPAVNAVEA